MLIRLRGPTPNDIFPKLSNVKYLSPIDVSSGYHNLKLDEKSSYHTIFVCQFGRYRYKRLPFVAAPWRHVSVQDWQDIQNLPNGFGIADDILVIGYDKDGKDHDEMLWQVLQICRQVSLKLNKDKCHFRCTSFPLFCVVISRHGVQPNPQKLKALPDMPPPKTKKELQGFLSIINYLGKFSPSTVEVYESLRKLMSA